MDIRSMKNEDFAKACFERLIDYDALGDDELRILTDPDECRDRFNHPKPILTEIPFETCDLKQLRKDSTGKMRFYAFIEHVNGRAFMVTNYWYGPNTRLKDNRTPFYAWVMMKTK